MIDECKILVLPVINEQRGDLTVIEANRHIPFSIQRVYYMSDVPEDAKRGAHAHKTLHQLIVPIAGSFDVHLDDGKEKKVMHMDRRDAGLYICPMIWRELDNFSPGAICMVLASDYYSEQDYYRNHDTFLAAINKVIK